MKRYRFLSDGLNCQVYVPKGLNINKSAIFLYGFPGNVGENNATEFLVKNGYTVFAPNYFGTYDSNGEHTPDSALRTMAQLSKSIKKGVFTEIKNNREIFFSPSVEIVVGASFGCFVALRTLQEFKEVKSMLLLAPAITFCTAGENYCGLLEDGNENFDYVIRSRPFTYRMGKKTEWQKLFDGEYDIPSGNKSHSIKNIFGLVGDKDNTFELEILRAKFKSLVQKIVTSDSNINLDTVSGGSHSADSLITALTTEKIKSLF
jgi:pimeloyl-ACP methyl ester carboxylesterase